MLRCGVLKSEIKACIQFEVSGDIHLDGSIDVIGELVRFEIVGVIGFGNAVHTLDDSMTDGEGL